MSRERAGLVSVASLLVIAALLTVLPAQSPPDMAPAERAASPSGMAEAQVRQASDGFYAALAAVFRGDLDPMSKVWSHSPQVTLMSPFGGTHVGWEQVRAQFERESKKQMAGQVKLSDMQVVVAGDLAYTTGIEEAEEFTVEGKPVRLGFRATSIYRREGGSWRMIHHHSDLSPTLQRATTRPS